jgi:hypothetical protein
VVYAPVLERRAPPPPAAPQQQNATVASLTKTAGVTQLERRREKKEDTWEDNANDGHSQAPTADLRGRGSHAVVSQTFQDWARVSPP